MALAGSVLVRGAALLEEGASLRFPVEYNGREREAFLLRFRGELRAFLNECPHFTLELDLGDGHFFDISIQRIYCKNHAALFHADTGVCETGPCLGRSLTQFVVSLQGEDASVGPECVPDPISG